MKHFLLALLIVAAASASAIAGDFRISSPLFPSGGPIPEKFGRSSENKPPPLDWSNPPQGTKCFALVVDDPDAPAGDWTHWLLTNIPQNFTGLTGAASVLKIEHGRNAVPKTELFTFTSPPYGSVEGRNSWGRGSYDGPQPPSGTHRYFFRIYALDAPLPLESGFSRAELDTAMRGHVLAETEIMGTYSARN